jgi:hypothetical protein
MFCFVKGRLLKKRQCQLGLGKVSSVNKGIAWHVAPMSRGLRSSRDNTRATRAVTESFEQQEIAGVCESTYK